MERENEQASEREGRRGSVKRWYGMGEDVQSLRESTRKDL